MKLHLAIPLLALAVAACGGTGTTEPPGSEPPAPPSPSTAGAAPSASSTAPSASPADAPPSPSASATGQVDGMPVVVRDFAIDPTEVVVDGLVTLAVTNAGPTVHNLTIRDADDDVGATAILREGEAETLSVELPAGTYTMYCSLPGHESLGMRGTLTVGD